MRINQQEPKQALNKIYGKVKLELEQIQDFKASLGRLLELCDSKKDEEFNKNLLIDFFKQTFYGNRYFINTKDKSDLVIHNDKGVESLVGVIFETKKPTKADNSEMPKVDNLNTKAFQQLILYFLRERITHQNVAVKHLIVTNIHEWFIFDAQIFETLFAQDKALVKQFKDFEAKRLSGTKTDFFYKQIAEPAIAAVIDQIKFTHFDLRNLDNLDLVDLYKLLSPQHLLKLPFVNDSNSLNKPFYNELLYIIGLTEVKEKGKKLIGRVKEGDRRDGSLIENAMSRLDSLGKLSRLTNPEAFGEKEEERLFNVALRLSINWINRILFLKLLEAQLIKYHQGNRDFAFLNVQKVKSYDDLDCLFFDVLAKETDKRDVKVKEMFGNVPYLNSSLFEPTETEQETIFISNLQERCLPIFGATVLKDSQGKRRSGELNALAYLFEFLDAYRFDRDELENPQEDSEKLINASVLGLIFEKINGYKDGSFYTPSFITMYMCRETIRRAVVQKFNEVKGWNCQNIRDLKEDLSKYIMEFKDRTTGRNEASEIFNSLKICDPAVGSGHFLVSALNEMISIKQYLGILQDKNGEDLSQYEIEVVEDKLKITRNGKLFGYNPKNKESQRVQETLFHEKQTIIESCLFGVDINPNSVTICRLRLWIELLKNAYYKSPQPPLESGTSVGELETLPNIDINIKCGNSLISRFGLDVDVTQVLKKHNFNIEQYRNAVQTYRNAVSKEQKREMESLIAKIKNGFSVYLGDYTPDKKKLLKLQQELAEKEHPLLFESETDKKAREKKIAKLHNEIDKLEAKIADIESGKFYENALEWRFEFPEVLNDDGDFVGFDIVIGNPPYIVIIKSKHGQEIINYFNNNYVTSEYNPNTYALFTELALGKIAKSQGYISFIIPNTWLNGQYFTKLRSFISMFNNLEMINLKDIAFDVIVETMISIVEKSNSVSRITFKEYLGNNNFLEIEKQIHWGINPFENKAESFIQKILHNEKSMSDYCIIYRGVETGDNNKWLANIKFTDEWKPILLGKDVHRFSYNHSGTYVKFIPKQLKSNANINYYNKNKILMRRTGNSIIACADHCKFIALKNLYLIIPENDNYIPIILLQLNSKLFAYIHQLLTTGENKPFAQFPAFYVEKLPCKIDDRFLEKAKVLLDKMQEYIIVKSDTTTLEKEINQLVYQLYGLTEEEIKIVEGEKN